MDDPANGRAPSAPVSRRRPVHSASQRAGRAGTTGLSGTHRMLVPRGPAPRAAPNSGSRAQLRVLAVLRSARPVVEVGPVVVSDEDPSGAVEAVHDRLDEDQGVVRRAE